MGGLLEKDQTRTIPALPFIPVTLQVAFYENLCLQKGKRELGRKRGEFLFKKYYHPLS